MRKLSITLLLISISFMTMKAYNLSEYRSKGSITFTSIFVKVDNIASRLNANFKQYLPMDWTSNLSNPFHI